MPTGGGGFPGKDGHLAGAAAGALRGVAATEPETVSLSMFNVLSAKMQTVKGKLDDKMSKKACHLPDVAVLFDRHGRAEFHPIITRNLS